MTRRGRAFPALLYAWLLATLLSGIPSTVYLLLIGGDVMQPTRDFWPQLADHLAWGASYSVGLSLARPRATRP